MAYDLLNMRGDIFEVQERDPGRCVRMTSGHEGFGGAFPCHLPVVWSSFHTLRCCKSHMLRGLTLCGFGTMAGISVPL